MFIRLLFTGLLVYLGYRFVRGWFTTQPPKEEVKGESKHRSLDLRDEDVEDARFEDIDEGRR